MEIIIKDTQSINEAAREFLAAIKDKGTCFAFYAPMGAGKTTFIKAVCEELGVEDVITSPTFAIVNEYTIAEDNEDSIAQWGDTVYHFDFYRIKKQEEVYDMGSDDYFYSGNLCFMEWPELIEEALPDNVIKITIAVNPDATRTLSF